MSVRQPNYYRKILHVLESLHKAHPFYNMGQHLSTAMDGSELWGVTDKELLLALEKYEASLEMDVNHNEEEIEDIIKDGMNLERTLFEEEED
jgi:hypothetical protein